MGRLRGGWHKTTGVVCVLTAAVLPGVGCAAPPVRFVSPYRVAARYDVEPQFIGRSHEAGIEGIRSDFRSLVELGFACVALENVDQPDLPVLIAAARDAGLQAVVRAGAPSQHWKRRARLVLSENQPVPASSSKQAIVDVSALDVGEHESPLQEVLAQYHAAISAGRTGGLTVDRARRIPGEGRGLLEPKRPLTPAQRTAIASLLDRAKQWGPRIAGFSQERVAPIGSPPVDVTVTLLYAAHGRYLLIRNAAARRYARGTLRVSAGLRGPIVGRAVEVAPHAGRPPGRVILARHDELSFVVALRPGDAVLYELF